MVWHGADNLGQRDFGNYCDAWHSDSMFKFGLASNLLRGKLLDQQKYSCNNAFIVLCVETSVSSQDEGHFRSKREDEEETVYIPRQDEEYDDSSAKEDKL